MNHSAPRAHSQACRTLPHPKPLLARWGVVPKKSLGQSFLFSGSALEQIVTAAELKSDDSVLEIGPGVGALTVCLAESAGEVLAIEVDERLLPVLREQLAGYSNVTVVHGNILELEPAALLSGPYKVVANLPYYITGAILRHLLTGDPKPSLMVLTVQREVAERLVAPPGDLSLLAVSVRFYSRASIVCRISAGSFWPRPAVESAVVRFQLRDTPLLPRADEAGFFRLAKTGFGQRRKQLQKNLRRLGYSRETIRSALNEAGIEGRRRAETLSLKEWRALYLALSSNVSPAG